MDTITWIDPRFDEVDDEPRWAVYDTKCGRYRINYDHQIGYTPCLLKRVQINTNSYHVREEHISSSKETLDDAMNVVNDYHCESHNLILT